MFQHVCLCITAKLKASAEPAIAVTRDAEFLLVLNTVSGQCNRKVFKLRSISTEEGIGWSDGVEASGIPCCDGWHIEQSGLSQVVVVVDDWLKQANALRRSSDIPCRDAVMRLALAPDIADGDAAPSWWG